MKIIDQTPFLSEGGKISALDQVKATLKYGADWLQEINAQKTAIACFGKVLDNKLYVAAQRKPGRSGRQYSPHPDRPDGHLRAVRHAVAGHVPGERGCLGNL